MTATDDISEAKRVLRRRASASRDNSVPAGDWSRQLLDNLTAAGAVPANAAVSGFWPIGAEIDVRPLLLSLSSSGHAAALPVVMGRGQPLVFRAWKDGDAMGVGPFGIREPLDSAAEIVPQVLLVPLLAFDRAGYRLGYGGGFYDRTLADLRSRGDVVAIGVAWAGQEVPHVPHDNYDQRLDWILTERECFAVAGTRA